MPAASRSDDANPGWREEFLRGIEQDLRWQLRDLVALWKETTDRAREIFEGAPKPDPEETAALLAELKEHWNREEG